MSCLTSYITALPEPLHSTYEIAEELGVGSYGIVYLVRDRGTQEEFALKMMEKEPIRSHQMMPQLEMEVAVAEELAGCRHVAQCLEITETSTHFFLRFELCSSDLESLCRQKGPMSEEEAFGWLRQACRGVQGIHARGILHRDLKPGNFLIAADGTLSICDFGFACWEEDATNIVGTPGYAAPECWSPGKLQSQQVDIYGLGASLQHLLLGRVPNGAEDMPKGVSTETLDLLGAMMSSNPDARPTIDELLQTPQLSGSIFTQFLSQWHVLLQGFSGQEALGNKLRASLGNKLQL